MLQISNLRLSLTQSPEELRQMAAKALGVPAEDLTHFSLARMSVDARRKQDVHYVCSVRCGLPDEEKVLSRCRDGSVTRFDPRPYVFPPVTRKSKLPPVVVGMGPAGLFAALYLARAGLRPVVLERGRNVDERTEDVEHFWKTGALSRTSNVQFGEGGAGTFSDGKLNTGTHDPHIQTVLAEFVRHGAPEDILWSAKPHVGTDLLRGVVKSIRRELIALGCDVRFTCQLTGLKTRDGHLTAVEFTDEQGTVNQLPCDALVLAPGHSARDTFQMLLDAGVPMEPKPFAVGVRIEHLQEAVSRAQYGPAWEKLPPADYKLACHLPSGRGVFSFCVCPGGQVVAAASDFGQAVTNGMSYRARDGKNINGGLLVGVAPGDYEGSGPLSGVRFQEKWERLAWDLGSGSAPAMYDPQRSVFHAPGQTVGSFLAGSAPSLKSSLVPTYRPGVTAAALEGCLPGFVTDSLRSALPILGKKLRGFDDPGALLTGVETRSSSPVRLLRDGAMQSPLRGLYPCGEGAGWAGGITSAAVDGIKAAEHLATAP